MKINILGHGIMGRQIAALLRLLGFDVRVWSRRVENEVSSESDRALKLARRLLSLPTAVEIGKISFTTELATLESGCTIETLVEDIDAKRSVLDRVPYDLNDVDLLTNTSSIALPLIGPNAVGLHFFNPVCALKLVEITSEPSKLKGQGRKIVDALSNAGFDIVRVAPNPGYIGNYMLFHDISAALKLVDRFGYNPALIDRVTGRISGSPSVFDVIDLIGLDTVQTILLNL